MISERRADSVRTIFEFDYSYCVAKGIPTHVHDGASVCCPARTFSHGQWISSIADLTDTVLRLSGLSRGVVKNFFPQKGFGFIVFDAQEDDLFFHISDVVDLGGRI